MSEYLKEMKKRRRISLKIAAMVGTVEIIAMTALFLIINHSLTKVLENKAMSDMNIIARDRAQVVESYIMGCCDFLTGYSRSPTIREGFTKRDDPIARNKLHDVTMSYASGRSDTEGLYIAKWDTFVLEHTNPKSVNTTFLNKENAKILEETIKSKGKAFCSGIAHAPVSKKMVIPVYAPVFDENKNAIGFAGGAFFTDALEKKLAPFSDNNIGYSVIDTNTNEYIFNNDSQLVGQKCTDPLLLENLQNFKSLENKSKTVSFRSKESVISCYFMDDKNWVFVVEDSNENAFGIVRSVRTILAAICIFITVILLLFFGFSVEYTMHPIRDINKQIENFKARDYSHSDIINKYLSRDDEFGAIANAVKELHGVLENQYQLFFELLEAQTVGTLVTDLEDANIILVNKMALKLWGIPPEKKATLTMNDIKSRFDKEETEKIANVRALAKISKEEIVYETSVMHDNGRKIHLLSHAKCANLSNGDRVIIFSFIDISAQKKLEANLVVLSETDSLTQICNRRSGEYKVKKAVIEGKYGMFCLFDANKFKSINDGYGHSAGDKVLIEIANCMKKTFRDTDILIRLGGDEFVVFAQGIESQKIGTQVLDRFMNNISNINIPELNGHKISISLGAVLVSDNEDFPQMYSKADSLMYECKQRGGNAYKFY